MIYLSKNIFVVDPKENLNFNNLKQNTFKMVEILNVINFKIYSVVNYLSNINENPKMLKQNNIEKIIFFDQVNYLIVRENFKVELYIPKVNFTVNLKNTVNITNLNSKNIKVLIENHENRIKHLRQKNFFKVEDKTKVLNREDITLISNMILEKLVRVFLDILIKEIIKNIHTEIVIFKVLINVFILFMDFCFNFIKSIKIKYSEYFYSVFERISH